MYFSTAHAGSGSARSMFIVAGNNLGLGAGGNIGQWTIVATGHLLTGADGTYDIGASGANRPRSLYTSANIHSGGDINLANALVYSFGAGSQIISVTNGLFRMCNNDGSDFTRVQLGGTTSAFPAIKRNGTGLDFRLADDSAYANIAAADVVSNNNMRTAGAYYYGNYTRTGSAVDGNISMINSDGTTFSLLQLGNPTASFPALKRDTVGIMFVRADDSQGTWSKDGIMTIASLPTAASAGNGAHLFVTDALTPAFGVTVASGGAVRVPVYSNGTDWIVG